MKPIIRMAAFAAFFVMCNSCVVASAMANAGSENTGKTMDPAIAQEAQKEDCWYSYDAAKAPGFCLTTKKTITWTDPNVNVGYWRGRSIYAPNPVLMEARGNTFIVYAGYVWDGNSVGHTELAHLMPSLRHDALYHALKEGAPLNREEIDAAYKADCERYGASIDGLAYGALRLFGGAFNDAGMKGTLIIELTSPPPAKQGKKRKKK